jgi:lauroyl/myristoyl acyltransferase
MTRARANSREASAKQRMPAELRDKVVDLPVPPMPPADLRLRLKTSPVIRRALPTSLVIARAERKGMRRWNEERPRSYALRTMEAVVAGTPREPELEQIARRHLVEVEAWEALFWQPWRSARVDAPSRELLLRACAGERGALLSACHLGPYYRKSRTLNGLGIEPYVVIGQFFFEQPSNDYWGRRVARWRRGVPDVPVIPPRGSFQILARALEHRETVLLYYDMPGRRETNFLGKPVMLVDGTARLAVETGALVVPVRSRRTGPHIRLEAGVPLDPHHHGGVEGLHEELARIHERWILEEPFAMADPSEYGWGDGATATRWTRPHATRAGDEARR